MKDFIFERPARKALEVVEFMLEHPEVEDFRESYLLKLGEPYGVEIIKALAENGYVTLTKLVVSRESSLPAAKEHLKDILSRMEKDEEAKQLQALTSKFTAVNAGFSIASQTLNFLTFVLKGLI